MNGAPSLWERLDRRTCYGLLVLIALAILSSATTLPNQFVQDDAGVIQTDIALHRFSLSRIFLEPYWPAPFQRDLYRPLATLLLAIQWWMGDGAPLVFRIISVTLYVVATLACFALARRVLPGLWAWAAAGLFAVHPVHVEAVAVGVNQGELMVGIILSLTMAWYLERRTASPLQWRDHLLIAGAMLVGGLFKEHAVVLPALVVLAELTLFRGQGTTWQRLMNIRPTLVLCTLALTLLLVPRALFFTDDIKGSFTAIALTGLDMSERTLTMLQVVPRWIYLLIWPSHLQADYSPRVIEGATSFGIMQGAGLALLVLCLWIALRTLRRFPVIAFGLGYVAITLLPVSNILVPTGIVMAERTLFAPSAGALLAIVGTAYAISTQLTPRPWLRPLALGLTEVLLLLGLGRSLERHTTWRNQLVFAKQLTEDAPLSFHAWNGLGSVYLDLKYTEDGRRMLRRSLELDDRLGRVWFVLADSYRHEGRCAEAIPLYEGGLLRQRYDYPLSALITCLLWEGEYARGRDIALEGIRLGSDVERFRTWLRLADSGLKVNAPPHTVRFPLDSIAPNREPLRAP